MIKVNGNNIKDIRYNGMSVSKVMRNGQILYTKKSEIPNGVYVQTDTGQIYTPSELHFTVNNGITDIKDHAIAYAIVSDKTIFRVPCDISNLVDIPYSNEYEEVPGVVLASTSDEALTDYNGHKNTQALIAQYGEGVDYAAGWCNDYTFPDGGRGYLGSYGEWDLLIQYLNQIIPMSLDLQKLFIITKIYFWTSTQFTADASYSAYYDGFFQTNMVDKKDISRVLPFGKLTT